MFSQEYLHKVWNIISNFIDVCPYGYFSCVASYNEVTQRYRVDLIRYFSSEKYICILDAGCWVLRVFVLLRFFKFEGRKNVAKITIENVLLWVDLMIK